MKEIYKSLIYTVFTKKAGVRYKLPGIFFSRECIFVKEREVSGTIIVVDESGLGEKYI